MKSQKNCPGIPECLCLRHASASALTTSRHSTQHPLPRRPIERPVAPRRRRKTQSQRNAKQEGPTQPNNPSQYNKKTSHKPQAKKHQRERTSTGGGSSDATAAAAAGVADDAEEDAAAEAEDDEDNVRTSALLWIPRGAPPTRRERDDARRTHHMEATDMTLM